MEVKGISGGCHTIYCAHRQDSTGALHHLFYGQSTRAVQIGSDNYPDTLSLYSYSHQYRSKGDTGCYKEVRSVKGSWTRIQNFVTQFDRSGYINEIKVCYESVAEICNICGRFQSLLEVNNKTHDHWADWEEFQGTCYKTEVRHGKVIGITENRVHVSTH